MNAILVDAHAHVWGHDMPLVAEPLFTVEQEFSVAQYLQTLDEHGIQYGFLAAASLFGDYNDYTIRALRSSPRLRGSVIVEPDVSQYVLESMHADGVRGIRLALYALKDLPDLTSFAYRRLFRRVRDLDWHVHVSIDGPRLPGVLKALDPAGVKVVVDHFGMPDRKQGIQCAGFQALLGYLGNGRTWVKVSGGYRIGAELAVQCGRLLLERADPERLMWASDCPFVGHENQFSFQDTIDAVRHWVPAGPLREQIFGLTALKLYFS